MSIHDYTDDGFDVGDDNNITLIIMLNMSIHDYTDDGFDVEDDNNITLIIMLNLIFSKEAKHVWEELKETYDKVYESVTFSLHHKIRTSSQNGSSIADYYHRLNALWKQFDALIELLRYTCHAADDFKKHDQLMNEESHMIASGSIFKTSHRANDNGNKIIASSYTLVCEKWKNVSNDVIGSSSSIGFPDEQLSTLTSLIKENCINEKGVQDNMADSRANQHISFIDKFLVNVIDIFHLKIKVSHPNGTEYFITKIRNMPLSEYLTLFDVLVMPEYCLSLMFMHKDARDSKLLIAFDELKCYILNHDWRAGKILVTSRQFGGLYYFDGNQGSTFKPLHKNKREHSQGPNAAASKEERSANHEDDKNNIVSE
nr:ribonuclease H-like domain-containing protein [Tanacetum cinerariifolium]